MSELGTSGQGAGASADPGSLESLVQSRLGQTLRGKYQLDYVLGVGGMAAVYAATHRNRKRFAIKVLHPEFSGDESMRARFLREGYAANSVRHAGAVSVLDDDIAEDGSAFLVMELLEGRSLEDFWLDRGKSLPVQLVLAIARQLLDVLCAAHAHGIVHRDLKPANLFLTRAGTLKVLDFGIARLLDPSERALTSAGVILGTPAFMAPELALGKTAEVDARSDIWAVGATLFVLISGQLVHEGDNSQQLFSNAATRPALPLESRSPGVPRRVSEVIDRALAFDKQQRWSSAAQMRVALERAHVAAFGEPISSTCDPSALARPAREQLVRYVASPRRSASTQPGRAAAVATARPAVPASPARALGSPQLVLAPRASARVELNIAPAALERPRWRATALLLVALGALATLLWQRFAGPVTRWEPNGSVGAPSVQSTPAGNDERRWEPPGAALSGAGVAPAEAPPRGAAAGKGPRADAPRR